MAESLEYYLIDDERGTKMIDKERPVEADDSSEETNPLADWPGWE